jgi:protein TonB
MFEDSLFASSGKLKTSRPVTVAISVALQGISVAILVLIPLIYTEALPARRLMGILITPPAPPVPRPVAAASPTVRIPTRPVRQQQELRQPEVIPRTIAILHEAPSPPIAYGSVTNQSDWASDASHSIFREAVAAAPPPPPPPQRISVGGQVAAARLIYQPMPVYPEPPRRYRIQGTVRLQAIIASDGTIHNLTVLDGHPMLIPAALEAVRQWRYEPTLLNGVPVEVETTIEVNFRLGG